MFRLACCVGTLAMVVVVGCSDSGSDNKGKSPAGKDPVSLYTHEGFSTAFARANFQAERNILWTRSIDDGSTPFNTLLIESWQNAGGPSRPGTYDLEGANFQDCPLCVYARRDCESGVCEKTFFADIGKVEITAIGQDGDAFAGTFKDVVMKEVTIDQNWLSTPVVGGETWGLDGVKFDMDIGAAEPLDTCMAAGTGTFLGDNVGNFALQNCNGDWVDLHSRCGEVDAVWLMLTAGWCPACAERVPVVQDYYEAHKDSGVEVLYILGEDVDYEKPSLSYCQQYASIYNLDPSRVLVDNGRVAGSYEVTFSNMSAYPYSDGSIGLPMSMVLDGTNMEYLYHDAIGPAATPEAAISDLQGN